MCQNSKQLIYLIISLAFSFVLCSTMALQILPPEQSAQADIWQHYYHSRGVAKALLIFLSVATGIGTIISFCLMLLTLRNDTR